jgi:LysM repeat protein
MCAGSRALSPAGSVGDNRAVSREPQAQTAEPETAQPAAPEPHALAAGPSARVDAAAHALALARTGRGADQRALVSSLARSYGNHHVVRMLARKDFLAGTHEPTEKEHAEVEAVLNPGSTVVVTPPVSGKAPPAVTVKPPPAMTDAGPGGKFEKEMLAALKSGVAGWANVLRTRKKKAPAFPVAKAHDIAKVAQEEVESSFGPLIQVASREVTDLYHPGSFDLISVLGDQSSRALTDGSRMGWTTYWMTLKTLGRPILDKYNVLQWRDKAEFARVNQKFALDPANKADIDDAIHSWPAEAGTGIVYIQPYAPPAVDTDADRRNRWDLYTTLIHEMMHKVAHPNFERTAQAIGGTSRKILTEGFADLMRHDVLWEGPGKLKDRLATPAMANVRLKVEGASYPYKASVVQYHGDYDEIAEARQIATQVGIENCKIAFFLGRTELLGIGAGTNATTSLAKLAEWDPKDAADSEIYVVQAGDSIPWIATRTGVAAGSILQADGKPLKSGYAPAAGDRVKIPGIRYVRSIQGDTLTSLGSQNGVTAAAIAAANGFPAASPPDTAVAAGRRILVPARP